jgi:hypothetical protein
MGENHSQIPKFVVKIHVRMNHNCLREFNEVNMQVAEMNSTWNGQISSFNGCCRVIGSLVDRRPRSLLISRSMVEIRHDIFKNP